ncbi:unnamed protein product [Nezara viridula]|uniref:Uncharacterized protein n=1 Tax=Nezara viridula TaxID=85310 RepID=A0A9P0HCM4_NEZVI|nr:unnamed protein product [Nezara viridula]
METFTVQETGRTIADGSSMTLFNKALSSYYMSSAGSCPGQPPYLAGCIMDCPSVVSSLTRGLGLDGALSSSNNRTPVLKKCRRTVTPELNRTGSKTHRCLVIRKNCYDTAVRASHIKLLLSQSRRNSIDHFNERGHGIYGVIVRGVLDGFIMIYD